MLRLRRQDRGECLGGGVVCPLPDGRGLRLVLRGDRRPADQRLLIELAVQVDAVPPERLRRVHRRIGPIDEHVD